LVENKVNGMENNLQLLNQYKEGEVVTSLDYEQYSVYINRSAWKDAINFTDFVNHIRKYFETN
jgi:hypothetical protein